MSGFGHVASREEQATHQGRQGIMRSVTAGVTLRSGAAEAWEEVGTQKWFLPVTATALARAKTLRQLSDDVRSNPGSAESLRLLDLVATLLVKKLARLHHDRRGLGMLTPDNALVIPLDQQPTGGDWALLLPDHGFVFENSPFPPGWISSPPEAGKAIWETDVRDQQWREGANLDTAGDVRLLVRLFQGLLTGRWQRSLLPPAEVAALRPRSQKLWKILDKTLSDPEASLQSLTDELAQFPLSGHFRVQPRPDVQTRRPRWPASVALVTVAMVVTGGGLYFWQASEQPRTDQPQTVSPEQARETTRLPPPPLPPDPDYKEVIAAATTGWANDLPSADIAKRNEQLSVILTQFHSEFTETHQKFQEKRTPSEWRAAWKKLLSLTQQILDAENVQTLPGLSENNQRDYQRCMRFIISLGGNVNVPVSFQESVARAKERAGDHDQRLSPGKP
jgi:hypothetical protein